MFVNDYAKFIKGLQIILNLIHVPSRFLYSVLLRAKGDSADALIELIPTLNPPMAIIRIDNGTEFVNNKLKHTSLRTMK